MIDLSVCCGVFICMILCNFDNESSVSHRTLYSVAGVFFGFVSPTFRLGKKNKTLFGKIGKWYIIQEIY